MLTPKQDLLFQPEEPTAAPIRLGDRDAIVREIRCNTLLNKCSIDDYSFNCYLGCSHGCAYCYARFMQRFHPHDEAWGEFVDARGNAPEALARQSRRLKPGSVFTCSACDGWQPIEEKYRLTKRCCELLLNAGFRLNILTKSKLVLRDLDILAGHSVCVGVTITTQNESCARIWEPGASSVAERIAVLREAKAAGLEITVMFGPLLPAISDTDAALAELFALAADTHVDRIWTDILTPASERRRLGRASGRACSLLRRHNPELVAHYQQLLFHPESRKIYEREVNQRIHKAAREAGVADRLAT